MRFLWPQMLWLLLAVPALGIVYLLVLRRRQRTAVAYASLSLIREALGAQRSWRRHLPAGLFLLGLALALLAVARPVSFIVLPSDQRTIIMAIDVSLSMRAADVEPNRITAAQAAAKAFIEEQPPDVRIGIVAFGATAALVQSPTRNREDLLAAVDRFQLQYGTATGSGLILALATLFPEEAIDLESAVFGIGWARSGRSAQGAEGPGRAATAPAASAVAPGSNASAAVILLSDGRRTTGPDPLEAARMAADHGVRVYTVGFGTAKGGLVGLGRWSVYVKLDEETLKSIAETTRGEYFYAGTAADLRKVYQTLNAKLGLERQATEVGALFCGAAALLLALAAGLSLRWFPRLQPPVSLRQGAS
jgi:Ca-activated chloride channel family protein